MQLVDEYIQSASVPLQGKLQQIRELIKSLVPEAVEGFSYKMPSYKLNGKPLLYFAHYPGHIGLYATPTANIKFEKELRNYKQGKGPIQFPNDHSLPLELIKKIIVFRRNENEKQ
ncbi:iron chaperone [Sphingobacterium sp. SYP-B4668]|uniref:iron chaperone n=1 Tax=Sphingobacterium sp. SYP-B4668 TaxID=2996035 RepID=UPI0022DE4CA4|nr:DUF1801 domain-containing protein [Sphingobacterium sp. SYP-B4668]